MNITISQEEILQAAQRYLIDHPVKTVTEGTAAQYQREFERIIEDASPHEAIQRLCNTKKKATYFKRKYAARYEISRWIGHFVKDIGTAPYSPNSLGQMEKLMWLLELGAGIDGLGSRCPIPKEQQQPKKSKRKDLGGLPSDWRERLLARMMSSKNYIPALVACTSGCRPSELRKGVLLRIEGEMLRIEIAGTKTGPGKGQPKRIIEYGLPGAPTLVTDLATVVELAGGELDVSINSAKAFSAAITYYGRSTFPRSCRRITPYSFRHQFASDIKKNLQNPDDVSQALGHRADRTRSSYGQAQQGRTGGLAPADIEATYPVRHVRSDPRGGPSLRIG